MKFDLAVIVWQDIEHRPLKTGRYIVAHRGHAEIMYFLSPVDTVWLPGTKFGWQRSIDWRPTHCALLPDIPQ